MKYIVLDLEASCWRERGHKKPSEIIEIGAVAIDSQGNILDEFAHFVRPQLHPILSPFCTELTSITQADVDQAQDFPAVLQSFTDWIDLSQPYLLCSWGFYDRNQLEKDCKLHQLETTWLSPHISVKHQYTQIAAAKKHMGMARALKHENLPLLGTHHRGIDDARNIAQIFIRHLGKWQE
ncbi:MAG: 3'-5' exonuclease [Bacteroidota bacterium]